MRFTIKTSGLMCGHCDATVETALLNVAGVTDADADHETQTVQVECADTVTAEQLAAEGIDAEVINMHTIKPIDADLIVKSATKTGHVVTVEEHSVIGGLGSAVADVLCEQCPTPLKKIGVNDTFGESGPGAELLHRYGLDAANIVATTKEFLA